MRRPLHSGIKTVLLALAIFGLTPGGARGPLDVDRVTASLRIFYAPRDNLREIDRAVLAGARQTIDFTGYVLTDRSIVEALSDAARRGVKVRLYFDPDQPALRRPDANPAFWSLVGQNGVEARLKTGGNDLMHLKAYHVDSRILRTGSANFSVSGGQYQDNDLLLIEGRDAVASFVREFEYLWTRPGNTPLNRDTPATARRFLGDDRP
ncbi:MULTISPECIES: phospholipase D-like domain-containing protein [unclassified Beijerinckia]|uniref:phospholipase D-like domain-containing protein n=1 Tax=unclassified Beijerinckia TaxID=2638183 RepID=UPI00089553A1|nr:MULTISPECIES: phospholipase D-like domain-containing protein [unclassified Beijerinckia]MDH7798478.1 phosphatidylserine/phosphatidylglycerophosphate/cardiolipin synthase-like enzyme [Beijerinckia sp. GAS462]SED22221.1 PLD-like domain-containing protein [Beijerinckia sp. 28-YEA-48]